MAYVKYKDPSNDDQLWIDVVRWEESTPQLFLASDIATGTLASADKSATIKYMSGTYSVVTSATLSSTSIWFYLAGVRAVYGNGDKSVASFISTFDHDLDVSSIALVKGNPRAANPEGLLLSWLGGDNAAGTKL